MGQTLGLFGNVQARSDWLGAGRSHTAGRDRYFTLHHHVQTGFGDAPAAYIMDTGKVVALVLPVLKHPRLVYRSRMRGASSSRLLYAMVYASAHGQFSTTMLSKHRHFRPEN